MKENQVNTDITPISILKKGQSEENKHRVSIHKKHLALKNSKKTNQLYQGIPYFDPNSSKDLLEQYAWQLEGNLIS